MSGEQRGRGPVLVHLPFVLVMLVVAVGLARISMYHWREGSVWIGLALLLAAGLRAVLRDEQAGLVAIRGRAVDVLSYGAFGVVVIAVAVTIQGGPLT
ncbi:DUF3017 domain-containing protein [Actinokineospora sp. NPDC004072]